MIYPKVHHLKTDPEPFQAVLEGKKRHEVRCEEDREFRLGDFLELEEYNRNPFAPPIGYSGRAATFEVTHLTRFEGSVPPYSGQKWVVMSITPINAITDVAAGECVIPVVHDKGVTLPTRATHGSAGFDLRANLGKPVTLQPGATVVVPCGMSIAIPYGFEGQVRPRSGLAAKHGVTVLNAPGTIDSDYRGEIIVVLINHGTGPFTILDDDRVAQLVIAQVTMNVRFIYASTLPPSSRGTGGFGSTGTT